MKTNRVLLLDGGGTQTLPIAKSLYERGHVVYIFYTTKLSYGYGTRYAYQKLRSPFSKDEKEYSIFFNDFVIRNSIEVVIPMSDLSALFLSKNLNSLPKNCNCFISELSTFISGYDKNRLMSVCEKYGFPHPKTIDLEGTSIYEISESMFPAILKPNFTTGGRGMRILRDRKELESVIESIQLEYGPCHLQEFVAHGGKQYKVELFVDKNHQLVCSSVLHKQRFYPVSGGSSSFNTTIFKEDIVDVCYEVLKAIDWIGFADFDLIEDPNDGIVKIMEINPRIPACIKSVIESGIDFGNIIVDYSMGRELDRIEYLPGKQLRHIGFDFLWFCKSKKRFQTKPSWFIFFNREQSFQDFSFRDPLPFILGTLGNIKKITNVSFRRAKQA